MNHRNSLLRLLAALLALTSGTFALGGEEPRLITLTLDLTGALPRKAVPVQISAHHNDASTEAVRLPGLEIPAIGSVDIPLRLPKDGPWAIFAAAKGYYAKRAIVDPSRDKVARMSFHPTGALTGLLALPRPSDSVTSLAATFTSTSESASADLREPATVRCELQELAFRCEIPAGEFDIELLAKGFAPRHFWGQANSKDESTSLGRIELQTGSNLVGEVSFQGGSSAACVVRLRPTGRPSARSGESEAARLRALSLSTTPKRRGRFVFENVLPGSYVVSAEAAGFATAERNVSLLAGAQSVLKEPLVLSPPRLLELELTPQKDPEGKEWSVTVVRTDSSAPESSLGKGTISAGRYRLSGLQPRTRYLARVSTAAGTLWESRLIDVAGDDVRLYLDLTAEDVEGTIRLGEKPLEARLVFGGNDGATAIETRTSSDGDFRVSVPRRDRWTVSIKSESPHVNSTVFKKVEHSAASLLGRLDVKLPNASFAGEVVDDKGDPVKGAMVYAESKDPDAWRYSEVAAEGVFTLSGLPEGLFRVHAKGRLRGTLAESEVAVVTLAEGETPSPAKLVLRPHTVIRGRVTDTLGAGVFGATLQPLQEPGSNVGGPAGHSDPAGNFEIVVPNHAKSVRLAVYAAGFGLRFVSYPLPAPQALEIPLSPASGTLELKTPHQAKGRSAILIHENCTVYPLITRSVGLRVVLTQGRNDSIVLPEMEPGAYTLCFGDLGWGASLSGCQSGVLTAGGELGLAIDSPEK